MSALSFYSLGRYTVQGASLGGLYTSLYLPELDALFDVGFAFRAGATAKRLFLSHAHLDHLGALPALLGMRGMMGGGAKALEIYCPTGIEEDLINSLKHLSTLHHWPLEVKCIPMRPGDEYQLRNDLWVRALPTFHPVPSLGYLFFERVQKLKPELNGLSGAEIKERKRRALRGEGPSVFDLQERPRVAYLTDTLIEAIKQSPEVCHAELLILECTFLSEVKPVKIARAGCHIHLDELSEIANQLANQNILLMHFSQIHKPSEVQKLCRDRLDTVLGARLELFLPPSHLGDRWWM